MSINILPTEVQCSIIRLLDPIGLISISQTNTHFRQLVNPQRRHFIEKLLALECQIEHGGITPIFRAQRNLFEPNYTDKQWDEIRFACTGCMRLRHHQNFDNHAILRLKYRKPLPGSDNLAALTTWEPDPRRSFSALQKKLKSLSAIAEEKRIRRRYMISLAFRQHSGTGLDILQECGMLDKNTLAFELEHCGYQRKLRKCLECRYQTGQLRPQLGISCGTTRVPIIASRQVPYGSCLERYFPRFSDSLEAKKPPFNAPVYRYSRFYEDNVGSHREQLWSLYMLRCPACECWQELREFRFVNDRHRWKPKFGKSGEDSTIIFEELLEEACCNVCFAKRHGREELVRLLSSRIQHLIDVMLGHLLWKMESDCIFFQISERDIHKAYRSEFKSVQKTIIRFSSNDGYKDAIANVVATSAGISQLRHHQRLWEDIWERMKHNGHTDWILDHVDLLNEIQVSDLNETEAHWKWLIACKAELKEKPEVLADWALSRDRRAFGCI
ncbi:hypothetical protein BGZ63DRAFT_429279 [Mariannaea sp. PMI_226]|nr:hypothetical protein BGZ63DRAFT_429279 [Mariannaea sp. PMI_226]